MLVPLSIKMDKIENVIHDTLKGHAVTEESASIVDYSLVDQVEELGELATDFSLQAVAPLLSNRSDCNYCQ